MKSCLISIAVFLLLGSLTVLHGGVTLDGEVLAAAGAVVLTIAVLFGGLSTALPLLDRKLLIPLTLILGGVLVTLFSPLPAEGRVELSRLVTGVLLLAMFLLLRPPDSARLLFYILTLVLGAGLIVYGIVQREGIGLSLEPLTATYVNRNHLASLLVLIALPAFSFSMFGGRRAVAWISRAVLPVLVLGILLTKSRGGILGLGGGGLAVGLLHYFPLRPDMSGRRTTVLAITLFLLVILGLAGFYGWFQLSELLPIPAPHPGTLSIRTRLSIWSSTLEMFLSRPIAGWGWGTFHHIYPSFKEAGVWYRVPHAHNEFLQLLAEGGVVGFLLILISLILTLRELGVKYAASPGSISGLLALGAIGSLVGAVITAGFDFVFRLPANIILLAVLVGLGLADRKQPGRPRSRRLIAPAAGFLLIGLLLASIFLPLLSLYRSEVIARKAERKLAGGEMEEAHRLFSRAHQLDPPSNRPLLGRAAVGMASFERNQDKAGRYASILEDFAAAMRNNPWDPRPLWQLSRFHLRLSAPEEAARYLEMALALDPFNAYLYYELAEIELGQGDYPSAVRHLRRASAIYTSIWSYSLKLVSSYTTDYEILRELPPPEDEFHRSLGYYLLNLGNPSGAEEEFGKALSLDSEDPENFRAWGVFHTRTGNPAAADEYYLKAIGFEPENHHWLVEWGDVLMELNRPEEALGLYLRACDLAPERRKYYLHAGRAVLSFQGPLKAVSFWRGVTEKFPDWSRPAFLRAGLLLELGRTGAAADEIDRALKLEPGNPQYLKLKARLAPAASGNNLR